MTATTQFIGGPWPCPTCGFEADHATGNDGMPPRPGDIGMCIECAGFYAFAFEGEQLVGLRDLTVEELAALDPTVRRVLLDAQRALSARLKLS